MNLEKETVPTRRAFSERMVEYGKIDREFAVFEADIGHSTWSVLFGRTYPDRYFNVGIAEQNMVASAAGMAAGGRTVFACSYGVFLTMRALETVRSFICYPNLNVKFLGSHGGITAAVDGVTHQATEDIGILTTLPNMQVLCPADSVSARAAFDLAVKTPGPVYVRLMRDPLYRLYDAGARFRIGGSARLREGSDVTIVSYGDIVFQALEAAGQLAGAGVSAEVLDLYSLKPVDYAAVMASVTKTGALVVAENHQKRNGLGYELASLLLRSRPVPFDSLGLCDTFAESGQYQLLLGKYGLSAEHIFRSAIEAVRKKNGGMETVHILRGAAA